MLPLPMRPPGTFKLLGRARRTALGGFDPHAHYASRSDRIVDSLRHQILEPDEEQSLRIRQIFEEPKEIYRIEIERPERGYQRTTLLDRDALEDLLATDDVRERFLATATASRAATVEAVAPSISPSISPSIQASCETEASREARRVPGAGLEPARPEARRF
jgi:hypothetical protein